MQHTDAEPPAKMQRTGSPAPAPREQSESTTLSAEPWAIALPEASPAALPETLAVIDPAVAEEQRVSASFADFRVLVTHLPIELWLVIFEIMAAWPTTALKRIAFYALDCLMQGSAAGRAVGLTACFLRMRLGLFVAISDISNKFYNTFGVTFQFRGFDGAIKFPASCLADRELHREIYAQLTPACFCDDDYMRELVRRHDCLNTADSAYRVRHLQFAYNDSMPSHHDVISNLTQDAIKHGLCFLESADTETDPQFNVNAIDQVLRDLPPAVPANGPDVCYTTTLDEELIRTLCSLRRCRSKFSVLARRFLPDHTAAVVSAVADSLSRYGLGANLFFDEINCIFGDPSFRIDLSDEETVSDCFCEIGSALDDLSPTALVLGSPALVSEYRLRLFDLFIEAVGFTEETMNLALTPAILAHLSTWAKIRAAVHCPPLWRRLSHCTEAAAVHASLFRRV